MNISLGLILGLTLMTGDKRPKLAVTFCNQAGVDEQIWAAAKTRTVRIFSQAGVNLHWVDLGHGNTTCILPAIRPRFVVVLSGEAPDNWTGPDAMGFAPAHTDRAYIFYNLVQRFIGTFRPAGNEKSVNGAVLAYAFAHEIGHLLIPGDGHGEGVMRPKWGYREWQQALEGTLLFAPNQARVLRQTLQSN